MFHKLSSDERKPGDLFDEKFKKVETELDRLASQIANVKPSGVESASVGSALFPSPMRNHPFGLSGTARVGSAHAVSPPGRGEVSDTRGGSPERSRELEARFHLLEARIAELKDQLQA